MDLSLNGISGGKLNVLPSAGLVFKVIRDPITGLLLPDTIGLSVKNYDWVFAIPSVPTIPDAVSTYYVHPTNTGEAPYDTPEKAGIFETVRQYAGNNGVGAVRSLKLLDGTHYTTRTSTATWYTGAHLIIESHSGSKTACILDGESARPFFAVDHASASFTVRNITMQNFLRTGANTSSVLRFYKAVDVNIINCRCMDNSVDLSSTNATMGAVALISTVTGRIYIANNDFSGNSAISTALGDGAGGAIAFSGLSATAVDFVYNNFTNNVADGAGAVVVKAGSTDITFYGNTYTGNYTDKHTSSGGAVAVWNPCTMSVTFSNETYVSNHAGAAGGAIYLTAQNTHHIYNCLFDSNYLRDDSTINTHQGGAVNATDSAESGLVELNIQDSTFTNNSAGLVDSAGGAIKYSFGAFGSVKRCIFSGNSAFQGGAIDFGGSGGTPVKSYISWCLFVSNRSTETIGENPSYIAGGGAWHAISAHSVDAWNNTYYGNTTIEAGDGNAVGISGTMTINLSNEIYRNGGVDEIFGPSTGTLNIDRCNIEGGAAAVSNETTFTNVITSDPLFTDPTNNDFTLQSTSPCIGAGTATALTGTDDIYDANGIKIYDGTLQIPDGPFIGGVDIGAIAYQVGEKYYVSFTVVSGTGPADWVVKAPAAPDLINIIGVGNTLYDLSGVPLEIAWSALMAFEGPVYFGAEERNEFGVYNPEPTGNLLVRINKYFKVTA